MTITVYKKRLKMKIVFVRHGHPNYADDCLTEKGILQAKAAAERLKDEKFDAFFASTCGRAYETCEIIAERHGERENIVPLEFMREIGWGSYNKEEYTLFENGHPWRCAAQLVHDGERIMRLDWEESLPLFYNNKVKDYVRDKSAAFDEFLSELGYTRGGDYYRVGKPKYDRIMIASHAGSSSAVISHALNLPFPYFCRTFSPDFTSITVLDFSGEEGSLTSPKVALFGDARHIADIVCEQIISN